MPGRGKRMDPDNSRSFFQERLHTKGNFRVHGSGEILARQGDPASHVLLLATGRATVVCTNCSGKQLLVSVLSAGDLVGEVAALDDEPRSATVTAIDSGSSYVFSAAAFRSLCTDKDFSDHVTRYMVRNLRASNALMVELAHLTVLERLARMLMRLLDAAGTDNRSPGEVISLSQTRLAEALGVARSSLAEAWAQLQRRGIVASRGHKLVVLAPHELSKIARPDIT